MAHVGIIDIDKLNKALDEISKLSRESETVIRCKDCFYYQQANFTGKEWKWCMVHHNNTEEENFCSWAERKEE